MYRPRFKITNEILGNIAAIAAAKEAIFSSPILPKWEQKLKKDAIISRTHNSTAIEGNKLTYNEVESLYDGKDVNAKRKDIIEAKNYMKALQYIDNLGKRKRFRVSERNILRMQEINCKDTIERKYLGVYRPMQVVVRETNGKVWHIAPKAKDVPNLMKEFIVWLNSEEALHLDPVLHAAIAHYQFVTIHPFKDGNGRTSRTLATLILYLRGFDTKRIFALDDYYNEKLITYYKALNKCQKSKSQDTTSWIEYFSAGVMKSMLKVKRKIIQLSLDRELKTKIGQIYLSDRQLKAVEFCKKNGCISNKDYRSITNLSNKSAYQDLTKMSKFGLLEAKGKSRNLKYYLKK